MTRLEALEYMIEEIRPFGYQKWQTYLDGAVIYDPKDYKKALQTSRDNLKREEEYVMAIEAMKHSVSTQLKIFDEKSFELLYYMYFDHPERHGYLLFANYNQTISNYPTFEEMTDKVEKQITRLKKYFEADEVLKAWRQEIYDQNSSKKTKNY